MTLSIETIQFTACSGSRSPFTNMVRKVEYSGVMKSPSFNQTQNAVHAIQERMNWHTVAIVVNGKLHQGAGTLLEYKDKKFILTCRHLIDSFTDKELRFIYRKSTPMKYVDNPQDIKIMPLDLTKCGAAVEITVKNRKVTDPMSDLALLEVSSPVDTFEFYPFPEHLPAIEFGKEVYLTGFPVQHNRYWKRGAVTEAGVFSHSHFGRISEKRPALENFNPKMHFLIEELGTDESKASPINPSGLSGAGVWSRSPSGENLWTPSIYLLGVQQAAYNKLRLLKATCNIEIAKLLRQF